MQIKSTLDVPDRVLWKTFPEHPAPALLPVDSSTFDVDCGAFVTASVSEIKTGEVFFSLLPAVLSAVFVLSSALCLPFNLASTSLFLSFVFFLDFRNASFFFLSCMVGNTVWETKKNKREREKEKRLRENLSLREEMRKRRERAVGSEHWFQRREIVLLAAALDPQPG